MFEPVIKSVEESFEKFSLGRMVYVIFLVALLGGAAYVFDWSTGYSSFTRIEKQIGALERLKILEERGIDKSPQLASIYRTTVKSLQQHQEMPATTVRYRPDWPTIVKFLAATCVPLAFAFGSLIALVRGKADATSTFGGAVTMVLFLGVPTLFIPTLFNSLAFTAGAFFTLQVVFISWFVRSYQKRRVPRPAA